MRLSPALPQLIRVYLDRAINHTTVGGQPVPAGLCDVLAVQSTMDDFLQWCKERNIRGISTYDVGYVQGAGQPMVDDRDDEVYNTQGLETLSNFHVRGRGIFGMKEFSAVGNLYRVNQTRYDGTIDYRRMVAFNNPSLNPWVNIFAPTSIAIDYANVETEFWNWDNAEVSATPAGSISCPAASRTVTGVGTSFTTLNNPAYPGFEDGVGDWIEVGGEYRQITNIIDNTHLEVDRPFDTPFAGVVSGSWKFGFQMNGAGTEKQYNIPFDAVLHRIKNVSALVRAAGIKLEYYFGFADPAELAQLAPYVNRFLIHDYQPANVSPFVPSFGRMQTRLRGLSFARTGFIEDSGSNTILGTGGTTLFLSELAVGCRIYVNGMYFTVASIIDDLTLTTVETIPASFSGAPYGIEVEYEPIISFESTTFHEGCASPGSNPPDSGANFTGFLSEGKNFAGVPTFNKWTATEIYKSIHKSGYTNTPSPGTPAFDDDAGYNGDLLGNLIKPTGIILFDQHLLRQLAFDPVVTISVTANDEVCYGACNGSINLRINSGVPIFNVSIYNRATGAFVTGVSELNSPPRNITMNGLCPGDYEIQVTDANGEQAYEWFTINAATALSAGLDPLQNVTCNGGSDGGVILTVGAGNWNYYVDALPVQTFVGPGSVNILGLNAGTHNILVEDDVTKCQKLLTANISQPTAVVVTEDARTNPSCGSSNGSIDLAASGGNGGPYTYSKDNGATYQSSDIFNSLPAGSYICRAKDVLGCVSPPIVINLLGTGGPSGKITAASGDLVCEDQSITLTITPTTGTAPFNYLWHTGATTSSITIAPPLPVGVNNVWCDVTDANGCTARITSLFTVTAKDPLLKPILSLSGTPRACGISNLIVACTNAGLFDSIVWQPTNTTGSSVNLNLNPANFPYTVIAYGQIGPCIYQSDPFLIEVGDPPTLSAVITDVQCAGSDTGAIDLTVNDGSAPYTFAWTGPGGFSATTQNISALYAGTYKVVVTDSQGCVVPGTFVVSQNLPLAANLVITQPTCENLTGNVVASPSGGDSNYIINWSNGATGPNSGPLGGGAYSVTIQDGAGCSITQLFEIFPKFPVAARITGKNPSSCGVNDGWANVVAINGSGIFSYQWIGYPGETNPTLKNIPEGVYGVIITDVGGCTATATITLTCAPVQPSVETEKDFTCCVTSVAYNATIAETVGQSNAYCLRKKSNLMLALLCVYNTQDMNDPGNCLTQEEYDNVKNLLGHLCNDCNSCN